MIQERSGVYTVQRRDLYQTTRYRSIAVMERVESHKSYDADGASVIMQCDATE